MSDTTPQPAPQPAQPTQQRLSSSHPLYIESSTIIGTKIANEVTHFVIEVRTETKTWCTIKRYSNFEQFHELLLSLIPYESLPVGCVLPGKRLKLWYNHSDRDFLEERILLLDNYMLRCIQLAAKVPSINELFVGFLSTDAIVIEVPTFLPTKQRLTEHRFQDDSEVTYVEINTVRVVNDHVLYQIDCTNSNLQHDDQRFQWTVLKRFHQFFDLDNMLRSFFSHRPDVTQQFFPLERSNKFLYDHLDPHFIEQRRLVVECYIQRLLLLEPVLYCEIFLSFIGVAD
jgi:hypothetical protein